MLLKKLLPILIISLLFPLYCYSYEAKKEPFEHKIYLFKNFYHAESLKEIRRVIPVTYSYFYDGYISTERYSVATVPGNMLFYFDKKHKLQNCCFLFNQNYDNQMLLIQALLSNNFKTLDIAGANTFQRVLNKERDKLDSDDLHEILTKISNYLFEYKDISVTFMPKSYTGNIPDRMAEYIVINDNFKTICLLRFSSPSMEQVELSKKADKASKEKF